VRQLICGGLMLGLFAAVVGFAPAADDDDKPKHTIKEVMKIAHKDGLLKKITDGTGTDDDKAKLLELYTELGKNAPPKGDKKNWEKLNTALVDAAKQVKEGKEGAIDALKKASACGVCHKAHKPD